MTSSLVGSEMCIRDRLKPPALKSPEQARARGAGVHCLRMCDAAPWPMHHEPGAAEREANRMGSMLREGLL
eukprot:12034937-Prorocentrum_lima.AAC.1